MSQQRPTIPDHELARLLLDAGLLDRGQVTQAARLTSRDKHLAAVCVEMGWLSAEQMTRIAPHAFDSKPAGSTLPANGSTSPTSHFADSSQSNGHVGLGQEEGPVKFDNSGVIIENEGRIEDEAMSATVKLCNEILKEAVRLRASDIHLEPRNKGMLTRYRVDGYLRSGLLIPKEVQPAVVSRMKVMANLNIAETRLSQDGRFNASVGGRLFDFRVSTLPGVHGEKVVLRLLDHSSLVTDLRRLGFPDDTREEFEKMLRRSHGMILVTGPTGSGKSTTLYAALATTLDETKNVVTCEDPVEYELEGVMQCAINPQIGNTFAARLRSILRQDPDVILVGEIRDVETADISIRAALTGHLVLSTLHTISAAAAIPRLQDMGIEPFLIASSLSGIIAQRLVRLICRHCREPIPMNTEEYDMSAAQWKIPAGTTLYHGKGCEHCNGSGHRGRVAIIELLPIDRDVRKAIMDRADADTIHHLAVQNGMRTLLQDGLHKVRQGLTTSSELTRALMGTEDVDIT
jgi:type II secretory ATPase GspE/PulE/Tfp pilus assembly ATPase PilB-like protein